MASFIPSHAAKVGHDEMLVFYQAGALLPSDAIWGLEPVWSELIYIFTLVKIFCGEMITVAV